MKLKLHTIVCSTRPGRVGPHIAKWFHEQAVNHDLFDAELVDIAEFKLPVYDEPEHPIRQNYQHEHTKKWAASVAAADAYVFVTPEYNYGPPPSLLNALNYLYKEWNYKPAALVSYGGVSGGLRAAQMEKLTLTTLKVMPIVEAVVVQHVTDLFDEKGTFQATDIHEKSAEKLLNELHRWAMALKTLR
ncbi:MAG: NAD(P)H-dependent oxidoreductase [Xanthomonadales bacterium]|nr:NAD(P)H-dependent oxidoreductase [Xanthomonadales bacterium]